MTIDAFEEARTARREAAIAKAAEKREARRGSADGLTVEQMREVEQAQDGDPSMLWERSQSWTKAQRKYAADRYKKRHGLFC